MNIWLCQAVQVFSILAYWGQKFKRAFEKGKSRRTQDRTECHNIIDVICNVFNFPKQQTESIVTCDTWNLKLEMKNSIWIA